MIITYCSNDASKKYGDSVFAVDCGVLPYEDMTGLGARFAHVVPQDVDENSAFGCPSDLVIDISGESPLVRVKAAAELLADKKSAAVAGLEATTETLIKSVADTDRQNSLSLMYNNMSTTDKGRAKTYFDWHKSMLSKHYATKALIAAATDDVALAAITGETSLVCEAQFADLMAATPTDAVDLSSYIH